MIYEKLGRTDISVSKICLGTMTFGEQNTEAEGHEQMDYALDQGVNFFDTAEMYSIPPRAETQGSTEKIIGSWFQARKNRDKVILATKIVGPGGFDYIRGGNIKHDAASIEEAVNDSLKRLQTDYIDLYQVHWPERPANYFGRLGYSHKESPGVTPIEETLEGLDRVVRAGKVRAIGLSNDTAWGVMRYLGLSEKSGQARVASVQNPYSLLNRSYEVGLAEVSCREDCGLLAYSPLGFGVLSGKYLDGRKPEGARLTLFPDYGRYTKAPGIEATKRYVALAQKHGLDPAQMALAFVNTRPFVTANIIGATTMDQLKANIASVDLKLSDDILADIDAIHAEISNPAP